MAFKKVRQKTSVFWKFRRLSLMAKYSRTTGMIGEGLVV